MSEPLREDAIMVPPAMLTTEWPPTPQLRPGGSDRFDAVYESVRRERVIHEPLIVNAQLRVIDGHHRFTAAMLLDIPWLPIRVWTGREWLPRLAAPQPVPEDET